MCAVLKSAVILNAMFIVCVLCNKPIAETTKGQVEGFKKDVDGEDVYLFMGIPYAKPPTAMRRFKPPESPDSWKATGVLNATHAKPSCPQNKEMVKMALGPGFAIEEISEDCLYLNVYTPTKKQPMKSDSLAVLFFLHGGGFQMGSGTLWDYSILARYANVVVVSINYRLGVLGFLATEDSAASGNWGLLDQRMALQWTQDNIENFGGDKTQVTLLGHAAGAYSVGLHIMSPMSRGLFKRAISQAGTIKAPALLNTNTLRRVKPLAMMVKCLPRGTAFDSKKVVACLRKVPFSELLKHDAHTSGKFTATVDGHFLPADPIQLLIQGKYTPVDYIIGGNNDEGSSVAAKIPNFYAGPGLNKTDFEKYIIKASVYALTKPIPDAAESALRAVISSKYFPREGTPSAYRRAYLSALGEVMISMMMKNAHYYSGKGTVFVYEFTHKPSHARFPSYVGAGHTEELPFIFGYILNSNGTVEEKKLSEDWMKTWGDFARTGKPNFNNGSLVWTSCKAPNLNYLDLTVNMTDANIKKQYKTDIRRFWNLALPQVAKLAAKTPPVMPEKCQNLNWGMSPEEADAVFIVLILIACFMLVIMGAMICMLSKSNKQKMEMMKQRKYHPEETTNDITKL